MHTMETRLDIEQLRDNADAAGQLLKALANPDRLLLLCQLSQGESNVSELEELLGIGQPTLSQQLAVLRREALVETRGFAQTETLEVLYRPWHLKGQAVRPVQHDITPNFY